METFPVFTLILALFIRSTDGNCSFPDGLRGVFISNYNGPMVFTNSHISGYRTNIPVLPKLELECMESNGTFFKFNSTESITVFGSKTHLYLCLEIEKETNTIFRYYIRTEYSNYLQSYIHGRNSESDIGEVCVNSKDDLFLLVRNTSFASNAIGESCPTAIQGYHKGVSLDGAGNDTCWEGFLESCNRSEHFQLNIDKQCIHNFGNARFTCLHYFTKNKNYLYTWTDETDLYSISPYGFFCMIVKSTHFTASGKWPLAYMYNYAEFYTQQEISKTDKYLSITVFADNCSNDTERVAIFKIQLYDTPGVCPDKGDGTVKTKSQHRDSPTSPAVVAVIVVIICISLLLAVIFLLHWQRSRYKLPCLHKQETANNHFNDIR